MNNYGYAIAKLRKKSGLTQMQLGEKLNVSFQAVSKWENNLSQPDIETFQSLLKIFGVTMEQFLEIAAGEGERSAETEREETPTEESAPTATEVAPAASEVSSAASAQIAEERVLIGTCTECGISVYSHNLGERSPRLLCSGCKNKKDENNAAKQKYSEYMTKIMRGNASKTLSKSFTVAIVLSVLVAVITAVICLAIKEYTYIWLAAPAAVATFTFVTQMFWDNIVSDIFLGGFGRGIHLPGLIFSFDLNGIIWLIAMKLLFALISVFISVLFVLGAFALAVVVSLFTFFPSYAKQKNEITNTRWHEPQKTVTHYSRSGSRTTDNPNYITDYVAALRKLQSTSDYYRYCK